MSRGYDARHKAKRQQARASAEAQPSAGSKRPRRLFVLVPILFIAAIFAVVGALGFGTSDGVSKKQIEQDVTELLNGIPQEGTVLGSPRAPVTVWLYADLECPTVKLFVENYLPSFVETWVRTGAVQLDYRSLKTDTSNEEIFFEQETAALAAGRQDRMWNFLLTFVRQQGEVRTDYVTEEFLADIASQAPGLKLAKWRHDRKDALLSKRVALGVYSGRTSGLNSTPSFLVGSTKGEVDRKTERDSIKERLEASLGSDIEGLRREVTEDFPTLRTADPDAIGG
jgi:protein-disulfide isomerase